MFLLDSNIVIYALQPHQEKLLAWLASKVLAISAVTRVEVLGFHKITEAESRSAASLLAIPRQLAIDDVVVDAAIRLRRQRRMSLADSLIAATALSHGLTLVTRNTADFSWVPGLVVVDPFAEL
ncbi:MAG: type II toxin-antitoxin system VapC family toxin [Deferrisomatales bacterium]|nr:type II toxin-antitoxin system VapC family toxin [Deferrisomatales bacterium]